MTMMHVLHMCERLCSDDSECAKSVHVSTGREWFNRVK
jgi:hypothetical protein